MVKTTEADVQVTPGRELPDDPEERVQVLLEVFHSDRALRFTFDQPHFPELTEADWATLIEEQEEDVERAIRMGVAAREAAKIMRGLGLIKHDDVQAEFVSTFISELRDVGRGTLSEGQLTEAKRRFQLFNKLDLVKADALGDRLLDETLEAENVAGGISWMTPAPFLAKTHGGLFSRLIEKGS